MATELQPAFGYLRVSQVNGRAGEAFQSPDLQRERIERLARERGYTVTRWFEDLDESGGSLDRPAFNEAREAILRGEADALLSAFQSRVSRTARDLLNLADELENREGAPAALEVADVPAISGPGGKILRTVMAAIAESELDAKREGFADARRRAVARGVYVAPFPPMGYSFDDERRLCPNEDAALVRKLFRMRGQVGSKRASLETLRQYVHANTGAWHDASFFTRLFANRAYLGVSAHGEFENLSAHKALVTTDEWNAAQPAPSRIKRTGTRTMLAGIARCASCGRKLKGSTGGPGRTRMYRCPGGSGQEDPCTARVSITAATLDAYVLEAVRRWARSEGLEDAVIETRGAEDAIALARSGLTDAEQERDAWASDSAGLGLPRETIREGLRARQKAVEDAREALEQALALDAAAATRTTLREMASTLTVAEWRLLIASVVERVTISRAPRGAPVQDRAQILWK